MARREQAVCDVCGKQRNCACWDYVVRKNARGKIAQYTPGTDTVYYENGREVGRSRNTTYAVGNKRINAARDGGHRVVAVGTTSVRTLETVAEMSEVAKAFPNTDEEFVTISAARSRKAGRYHLMTAENPVWILAFTFCRTPEEA